MIDQFHTLLLPVDYDFVKMRCTYLLSLDNQVVLSLVGEVYLDLIKADLLVDVSIHLSNMLWVQILNSSNVDIGNVKDVPTCVIGLLLGTTFVRVGSNVIHTVELLLRGLPHNLGRVLVEGGVATW